MWTSLCRAVTTFNWHVLDLEVGQTGLGCHSLWCIQEIDVYRPAGLDHRNAKTEYKYVRLGCSILWQAQDLELGEDLIRK